MPTYEYSCKNCGVIDIFHGMNEENKTICPECSSSGLQKLISAGSAIIISGREANQYNDIKAAKYWRDKNGVRHKVTSSDGYSTSASINKQTATPEQVKQRKLADRKKGKEKRMQLQKNRADKWNKEQS